MKRVFLALLFMGVAMPACLAAEAEGVPTSGGEKPPEAASPLEAAAADTAPEVSPLAELDWLVGNWVDQDAESTITTRCAWTKNHKFLTWSFSITEGEEVVLEGTQVIGWDASAKRIRSWTFDSEGGFGEALWSRDGNRWLAKTAFVLASGENASSVNVVTYVDQNTFTWRSINREVGGDLQPNVPEVTIVRQPAAAEAGEAKETTSAEKASASDDKKEKEVRP